MTSPQFETTVRRRLEEIKDEVAALTEGADFWKVKSPKDWYTRRFQLNIQDLRLQYGLTQKSCFRDKDKNVNLSDVTQVRTWTPTFYDSIARYGKRNELKENCYFTIVVGTKEYNLVAHNEQTAALWMTGLEKVLKTYRSIYYEFEYELWIAALFKKADKDKSGTLSFTECLSLLKLMNIQLSSVHAKELFKTANVNNKTKKDEQALDSQQFVTFINLLVKRKEIEEIFHRYAQRFQSVMTTPELVKFLKEDQKMDIEEKKAKELVDKFEASKVKNEGYITLVGFIAMMKSEKFNLLEAKHSEVCMDMTRPLAHYYIASSHNTYLTGNQLTSKSSVSAYIDVLEEGCRCVELDLWDGPNGEPIILHGHTMTSSITVRDVLVDGIKPYAFKKSPYPLILSLENHLSAPQQTKLAEMLIEILGDLLYTKNVSDDMKALPSPEELKNKILVKAKRSTAVPSNESPKGIAAESAGPAETGDSSKEVSQSIRAEDQVDVNLSARSLPSTDIPVTTDNAQSENLTELKVNAAELAQAIGEAIALVEEPAIEPVSAASPAQDSPLVETEIKEEPVQSSVPQIAASEAIVEVHEPMQPKSAHVPNVTANSARSLDNVADTEPQIAAAEIHAEAHIEAGEPASDPAVIAEPVNDSLIKVVVTAAQDADAATTEAVVEAHKPMEEAAHEPVAVVNAVHDSEITETVAHEPVITAIVAQSGDGSSEHPSAAATEATVEAHQPAGESVAGPIATPDPMADTTAPESVKTFDEPNLNARTIPSAPPVEETNGHAEEPQALPKSSRTTQHEEIIQVANENDKDDDEEEEANEESSGQLSDLVNLCAATPFKTFHQKSETGRCYHISSLSETKAKSLIDKSFADFVEHTRNQLVRIYPKGLRTDSSNYEPLTYWNAGCQVVALNYQTYDMPKKMNFGKFNQNGNCGYVLKPQFLLTDDGTGGGNAESTSPRKLVITIISGQNFPIKKTDQRDILDPYVTVRVVGDPQDSFSYKTQVVSNNGLNPLWNEMVQIDLKTPELDILYFSVKDKDSVSGDDPIGWYSLPVTSLAEGYRHMPLMDEDGKIISMASLFVHVAIHREGAAI